MPSTTIAIAGGTGGVGRAILEILNKKHGDSKDFTAIVLSRNTNPELEAKIGAKIVKTDYADEEAMVKVLEEYNVGVVISTMPVYSEADRDTQIRLVCAADRAAPVKRFIPSDFGYPDSNPRTAHIPVLHWKQAIRDACRATTTPLEHSSFRQGFFMDYFGMPNCHSYLRHIVIIVDVVNNAASIPGDGTAKMVFTNSFDVAEVIVHYLSKPPGTWKEFVEVYGDKKSWNEVVKIMEDAKGIKFEVKHDDVEDVRNKKASIVPHYENMGEEMHAKYRSRVSVMGPHMAVGDYDIDIEAGASKDEYPEGFKPIKMGDFLRECWEKPAAENA